MENLHFHETPGVIAEASRNRTNLTADGDLWHTASLQEPHLAPSAPIGAE